MYSNKTVKVSSSVDLKDVKEVKLNEFLRKFSMKDYPATYKSTENINKIPKKANNLGYPFEEIKKEGFRLILNSINSYQKDFVIANMGDYGYGVITQKSIKKNTPIAIYGGELRVYDDIKEGLEYFQNKDQTYLFNFNCRGKECFIDAKDGNISRFFQHAPDENEYIFEIAEKKEVAFSNLDISYVLDDDHVPYAVMITKSAINSGELLTWNYSVPYWLSLKEKPVIFNKNGSLFSGGYSVKDLTIRLYVPGKDLHTDDRAPLVEIINYFKTKEGMLYACKDCPDNCDLLLTREDFNKNFDKTCPYVVIEGWFRDRSTQIKFKPKLNEKKLPLTNSQFGFYNKTSREEVSVGVKPMIEKLDNLVKDVSSTKSWFLINANKKTNLFAFYSKDLNETDMNRLMIKLKKIGLEYFTDEVMVKEQKYQSIRIENNESNGKLINNLKI